MVKATENELLEIRRTAQFDAFQAQIQNLNVQVANLVGEIKVKERVIQDLVAEIKTLTQPKEPAEPDQVE